MKNALLKDIFREVKGSLSRFLSIFAIITIGVAFFAGINVTDGDMKQTADKYFDDYHLMDIRLVSTIGFNDEDIEAIKKVPGIEGIMPTYSMDALIKVKGRETVLKVIALPVDKIYSPDSSYINRVKLVEGRYPGRPDECLAERDKIVKSGLTLGSKIKLFSGTDKNIGESLKVNEFTIVGIAETPYYISLERGNSTIGNGKVNSFIMIPKKDFTMPCYTDIFITVKGARETACYSHEYDDIVESVKKALENVAKEREDKRYKEILSIANKELDKQKKQLDDARLKQNAGVNDAEIKFKDSRTNIQSSEAALRYRESEFNDTIREAETKLNDGFRKLEDGEKEYYKKLQEMNDAKIQAKIEFASLEQRINDAERQLDEKASELDRAKMALTQPLPQDQRDVIEAQVKEGEKQIEDGRKQIEASKEELEKNKASLRIAEEKLAASKNELDETRQKLEAEKKTLQDSKDKAEAEFVAARKKIEDSKKDLEEGQREFESARKETDIKINDSQSKIDDAQEKIDDIEKPKWYVLDRDSNPGFVDYGNAADSMGAIAKVFPVFFFLIAALVCLTSMTRMVDEQRTTIGTFKALGYSRASIASKYILYAASASITGSIAGVLIGFRLFPTIIFDAYGIMYTLPPVIFSFSRFYAGIATVFAVLSTTIATLSSCYRELVITPASLMRPRAPKAGKRILLERIKFIWRRLNFTQKVTARNLMRYKKRFLMTIIGIGGCTALLLSGFGIRDSIMSIVTKQFDEIYQYDVIMGLRDSIAPGENAEIKRTIQRDRRISGFMLMKGENVDAGSGDIKKSVTLIIPESTRKMENFIVLRDRITKEKVPFSDKGVILTEKLAKMLNAGVGSEIYIKDEDDRKVNVKVAGIAENYVSHYIYMSPALYEQLYDEKIKFNEITAKTTDTSKDFEDRLSTDLMKNSDLSSINFTTGISKNFKDIIGRLNYIVLVLIVSAGALAFVVLYNLTNINISERLREIATIKVLGFYDREVSVYVYRENIILTLIGMALGLGLGIFLHRFIMTTAEVDYVMFGRTIMPLSYLYASVLTMFFSGFVNFVMYFKLRKIKMVESLKSMD